MILADKIIRLRKKNGWSQEELADKLQVSRQAVSKWEGAQTIPDIERILAMSRLFGVTVDYLLKDEQETEMFTKEEESIRQVSLEEAGRYLALRRQAAKQIALGTYLCILGIIPMLLLGGAAETGRLPITENMAGGRGPDDPAGAGGGGGGPIHLLRFPKQFLRLFRKGTLPR